MSESVADKAQLRTEMRRRRRSLPDGAARSERVVAALCDLEVIRSATSILVFDAVPGEPDLAALTTWCRDLGISVAVPEDDVDPTWPDVVVVPGVAFTRAGDRLGQGGGWYDRFLVEVRDDCTTIGVCFSPSVVEQLPVEPHDVPVDLLVTDSEV